MVSCAWKSRKLNGIPCRERRVNIDELDVVLCLHRSAAKTGST